MVCSNCCLFSTDQDVEANEGMCPHCGYPMISDPDDSSDVDWSEDEIDIDGSLDDEFGDVFDDGYFLDDEDEDDDE